MILAPQYGFVMLAAACLGLECLLVGFLAAGTARRKVFTEQFMRQNFGQIHRRNFGEIKQGGFPDSGSGFYAMKLSYEDWYRMNNGQRVHMNFVEMVASTLIFLVIGGLYYPVPAAALGLATIIFRIIYTIGYVWSGPHGRLIGAFGNDGCLLGMFILAIISSIRLIQNDP